MNILVNCSNLKQGGGVQVGDSVCCQLQRFSQHTFYVVLSSWMGDTKNRIGIASNIMVYQYDTKNSIQTLLLGRDSFLDGLVAEKQIDIVLTVFGPSRWCPRVPHLSGFALSHLVIPESPYFQRMEVTERMKWYWWCKIRKWSLKRSASCFWTENYYISERLARLMQTAKVYTVTNYYNQVFDSPKLWAHKKQLPEFEGITTLSVSSYYPHKNFEILIDVARYFMKKYPDFHFRFVLTFEAEKMPVPDDVRKHFVFIGKVDVSECPNIYEQADIMVMPTLLECFTATYPEAMRMNRPIVTTDLEFARGLCADAACYYSAVDPIAAAEAIYKVATNKEYADHLVAKGREQLKKFDNYEQRAERLIGILEEIVNKNN